jgi:hypothetical protein
MLSRGDNLGVGGEQDVEAKALRSVRWYARRWREQLSQKWLQSCKKMPSPAASCWASNPQRWIDIKRNQCRASPSAPAPPYQPHGRRDARGGHLARCAERPRGHRASRGPRAARRLAPHSLHPAAAPAPGECRAAVGRLRRGCLERGERLGQVGARAAW